MKLSRTGWNNVVIFSVMLLIVVINLSNHKLFNKTAAKQHQQQLDTHLIAEHEVILSLVIAKRVTIERVGTSWRATPEVVSGQALEQMMLTWQTATGTLPLSAPPINKSLTATQFTVQVNLASQAQPITYIFTPTAASMLIYNQKNKQTLEFPLAIYHQLIPFELR